MKRKFSFRILLFVALLVLSLFCIMVASLPFFTRTHDLGRGFLADAGAFLRRHLGFFPEGGPLGSLTLVPVCLFLILEAFWVLNGWKRWTGYLKALLALPIFITLRLLFLLGGGQGVPYPFSEAAFFDDKWALALLLMGESALFALAAGLSARLGKRRKSARPKAGKKRKSKARPEDEAKPQEAGPSTGPGPEAASRAPLETSIPEFAMFKRPQADGSSEPDGMPPIRSSVGLGVYGAVLKEAELERKRKEEDGAWPSQPGALARKAAEDERTQRLWQEMERKAREDRDARSAGEAPLSNQAPTAQKAPVPEEEASLPEGESGLPKEADLPPREETAQNADASAADAAADVVGPADTAETAADAGPDAGAGAAEDDGPRPVEPKVTIIAPPPPLTREERAGWRNNDEENYDLYSGIGGLERAEEEGPFARQSYQFPPKALLKYYPRQIDQGADTASIERGRTIIDTLAQFKVESKLVGIIKGPTVTMFEIALAPGIKVSAVTGLADNISMDLAAPQVRLLAPIPGKQAIGVEVPNFKRDIIGFSEIIDSLDTGKMKIPVVLGKKITGENVAMDLSTAPHVLIAGATGSGKSVCVNSIICSILYTKRPDEVRMIMVDPKIVELKVYNGIPHLLTPVITDPKKAIKAMQFCLEEMERRYHVIGSVNVRNISAYNEKIEKERLKREKMPYILVIMDEFADLMAVAGKELETMLHRLSAMARAVGIHLVFATQRPSADVVTGLIKNNLPTKIAFSVTNQINSKIILDCNGAEKLLGRGDMLYATSAIRDPERIQGAFLSDGEVESIAEFVKTQGSPDYLDEGLFEDEEDEDDEPDDEQCAGGDDALFDRALKIVCERQSASASYLQRRLSIGYNKAARLVERMEELGYVGPARGSKPREVLKYPD